MILFLISDANEIASALTERLEVAREEEDEEAERHILGIIKHEWEGAF